MIQKFFSKEIHFLRADSDDVDLHPPDFFFSDLLQDKSEQIGQFEKRLSEYRIPKNRFVCAVIRIDCKADDGITEKANTAFEETFNAILDHERGLWESLTKDAIALAFWDYENTDNAISILKSIQEKLAQTLDTDILVGVAAFPFQQFDKEQTFANALKAIDHAAFYGPSALHRFDAVSLNISADRLYQLGHFEMAIEDYRQGLVIDPRNTNLMNSLGVCYGVMNELEKAREQFQKALKITPKDALITYNIGLIYMIEENIEKAVVYLRKAHAEDSRIFEVELLLGQLLLKQDRTGQALPHLETAARLNTASSLASRFLGEIYLDKGDPETAAQKFNTAIKCNPSDAVSLSGYARCLEMQDKNLPIACTFARTSIELDPGNALFQERLDTIMEKLAMSGTDENSIKTA